MALVVICGQPCSGKSTVGAALKKMIQQHGLDVNIIDEPGLSMTRNESYKDSVNEKNTRGRLKSAVEKAISRKAILILDSLNNIKGYRYELWCIARAASTRYCMVHCAAPEQAARAWNAARAEQDAYAGAIFADLWRRFEEPDSRNRWDQPLFRVATSEEPKSRAAVLQGVVEAVVAGPEQQHRGVVAKQLHASMATSNPSLQSTNLLHELDSVAQEVIATISAAQELAGSSGIGRVDLGDSVEPLHLQRSVTLTELRRHKRMFLKLSTQNVATRLSDRQSARRMFVDFLREHLD